MVNVFGKKAVSSVLAVLIFLSVFLTLPMTAEKVNAAVSAPENLKAVSYSDSAVRLNWSKANGVTGYIVYYSTDNSNFTRLKSITSQSVTAYTVSGLKAGTSYYFALISYTDVNGKITKSSRTSSIKVTTTSKSSLPAPTNFKVTRYSDNAIILNWNKSSNVTGYYIYRSTDGKSYSAIRTLSASATSYSNTSLTSGKKYYYMISAYKKTSTGATAISPKSSAVSVTTTSKSSLPAPTNFKITRYSDNAIILKWDKVSNATGYYIYRSTDGKSYSAIKTLSASATSYNNASLTSGKKYYYMISSYNKTSTGAIAISPKSSAISVTTTSKSSLSAPANFKITRYSDNAIILKWDKVSNATGYYIYRSTDGKSYSAIKTLSASATSYNNASLTSGKKYYYMISAYKKTSTGTIAISPKSSAINVTTTSKSSLPIPTGLSGSAISNNTIKLAWNKVSNVAGYYIYRSTDGKSYSAIKALSPSTTTYIDTSLAVGKKYYYMISSYNKTSTGVVAIGPKSSAITVTATDKGLVSCPSGLKVTECSPKTIKIVWNTVSGVSGYYIYRSSDNANFSNIKTVSASVNSFTDSDLNADSSYYYKIAAYKKNSDGTITTSAKSSSVKATTTFQPVNITETIPTSSTSITLKWEKYPYANGYQIFRLNESTNNYEKVGSTNSTSYTDKNLKPYTRYYYKVRAYIVSNGITSYSSFDMADEMTCPEAVTNFSAKTMTYYSIMLKWNASSLAKSYEIYQLAPNESAYHLVATVDYDKTSYVINNLNINTEYKFKIRMNTRTGSNKFYSDFATASATTKSVTDEISTSNELFKVINNYRASKNIGELKRNKNLDSLAAIRAEEITQKFSNTRPDGTNYDTVLYYADMDNYYYVGENIAMGMKTAKDVLNVWLDRDIESQNINSSHYNEMGVAMCYKGNVPYYVVIFYRAM